MRPSTPALRLVLRGRALLLAILCLSSFGCGPSGETSHRKAQKVDFNYYQWKTDARAANARARAAHPDAQPKYPGKAWDWFYARRAGFQTHTIPIDYREQARAFATAQGKLRLEANDAVADWKAIGPFPPRGRLKDLAVHPANDQIIYAASASGGIWKTTDQGRNWSNLTDNKLPTLGIGSLIMDPNNPNTLYAGLGEGLYGVLYDPLGSGVYRTDDGGQTWALTPGSANNKMQVTVDLRFGENSQTLFAACIGARADQGYSGAGFFKTTDGGQNWTKLRDGRCWSISVDPTNPDQLLLTVDEREGTAPGRIYYSTDGGQSFTPATIPTDHKAQRIELARAPSNSQMVYALAGGTDRKLAGIWKSTNGGQDWTALPMQGITTNDSEPSQMEYNNCIAVAPNDPNTVYIGTNLRPYKTTDGGQSWTHLAFWWIPNEFNLPYMHADHHAIAFGANANTVMYGTDGGFHISPDGGASWEERNNGLLCTQIYRLSNPGSNPAQQLIGCQDNNLMVRGLDNTWRAIKWFGDGFECIIDRGDNNYVYGASFYGANLLLSHSRGENNTGWYYLRGYQDINNGIPDDERGAWVVPFIQDPLNPSTLYVGLQNIYRITVPHVPPEQTPDLPNWSQVVTSAGSAIQMEVMRLSAGPNNRAIYFFSSRWIAQPGSWKIALYRINQDGTNPTELTMPRIGFVNEIACDPVDNETVWIAYSDVGATPGENTRIHKSTDAGATWTDMTNNLPRTLPVSAIWIDPTNTQTLVIGTDLGCYRSDDGGASWFEFNQGLPNTVVTDLAYHPESRALRAATYGRGAWETPIDSTQTAPKARVEPSTLIFP